MLFEVTPENEKYMTSVPFTLEFYKIPVIGLSPRSSVLSNTVSHDCPSPRYLLEIVFCHSCWLVNMLRGF